MGIFLFIIILLRFRQLDSHIRGQGQFGLDLDRLDDAHRYGTGGVGAMFVSSLVDVEDDYAHYQVKNSTIGGTKICDILLELEKVVKDGRKKYVAFKPKRGTWVICELLTQNLATRKGMRISP